MDIEQTVVSFQGAPLSTTAELTTLVLSILGEPSVRPGLSERLLGEMVAAFGGRGVPSDTATQYAGGLISRWSGEPDPALRAECAAALSRFHLFVGKTMKAACAYNPNLKPNPTAVFWPDPTAAPGTARSLFDELPLVRRLGLVDRATPLGSAGSCFATEIAKYLQANGYNYVLTEPNAHSSANWGIIFNTPSFRQMVERAFGVRRLPPLLWVRGSAQGPVYLDPFREGPQYASVEEYEADLERHVAAAREALTRAEVFIITLGMNEIWRLKSDGSTLSRAPWNLAPYLVEQQVMTPEENVVELERMLSVWRTFNPRIKLIVTVSPVPLHATFRADDLHVIAANSHSKAVLRVAADMFCARNRDVHYFPSYEMIGNCIKDPWDPDQRHIAPHAVARIMELFQEMFVR